MKWKDVKGGIQQNPMYWFLMVMVISASVGFQAWRILFNNFAKDELSLNGFHVGVIQSLRELPGFLVFLVVYVLLFLKEHTLSAFSIILLGIGIGITGFLPSFEGLLFSTFVMSIGFHYFETTNKSLTMQYFNKQEAPYVFGKLRAFAAIANIAIGAAMVGLTVVLSFKMIYLLVGLLVSAAGIYMIFQNPSRNDLAPQQKKIVLKKKYWLFYILNFLSGARRQIFVVFAVFLVVEKYNFPAHWVAILFVINNLITYFVNPVIAKSINAYGERKVLTFEYVGLIFVFLSYALFENIWIVALLYILDHIFFNFAIGINTYLQKIADPEDITPSASAGFAINHIMAVIVPILGGYLWLLDWKIPFYIGAGLSFISLFVTQMIKVPEEN